jgi:hypothetical protein
MDGDYAFVGSPNDELDENDANVINYAGSATIFKKDALGNWNFHQKVDASDRSSNDYMGHAVAISGDYAVVNAYSAGTGGKLYVYQKDASDVWNEVQQLEPADVGASDLFSYRVDMQGDYLIVGSPQHDYDENGLNHSNGAGTAYIYKRTGGVYALEQKIVAPTRTAASRFGHTVAINGTYAIVGEPYGDPSSLSSAGNVYVYERSGTTWSNIQTMNAPVPTANDQFGSSVAINSNSTVVIGAWGDDEDVANTNFINSSGSAYVYDFGSATVSYTEDMYGNSVTAGGSEGTLNELSDISGGSPSWSNNGGDGWMFVDKGDAPVINGFDVSGTSIVTVTGVTLHVKYSVESGYTGSNYVQFNNGAGYTNTSSQPQNGESNIVDSYNLYAAGVTTLADLNSLLIRYVNNDGGGADAVSFDYIYLEVTGTATGSGFALTKHLVASDRASFAQFGVSADISDTTIIIGAPGNSTDSLSMNSISNSGAAYIYTYDGTNWVDAGKLVAPTRGPGTYEEFGRAVAVSNGQVGIGQPGEDEDINEANALNSAGAAYFRAPIVIPLPVDFVGLELAELEGNNVEVSWRTESELNNDYFQIERSQDGIHFEEMGRVAGSGTSTTANDYVWIDESVSPGGYFYRIRHVDFNGSGSLSDTEFIRLENNTANINVYPNPFVDEIIVAGVEGNEEMMTVRLFDISGRDVSHMIAIKSYGDNELRIAVKEELQTGMYLFSVMNSGVEETKMIRKK